VGAWGVSGGVSGGVIRGGGGGGGSGGGGGGGDGGGGRFRDSALHAVVAWAGTSRLKRHKRGRQQHLTSTHQGL